MKLLTVAVVLSVLAASVRADDTCLRDTECPVVPACRALTNHSLFFAGQPFFSTHAFWLPHTYDCPGGVNSGLLSEYYFFANDGITFPPSVSFGVLGWRCDAEFGSFECIGVSLKFPVFDEIVAFVAST